LAASLPGHVLDEYYEAKKDGINPTTATLEIFEPYHNHALVFEGEVLSELTGKAQGTRDAVIGVPEQSRRPGVFFSKDEYYYNNVT
jgi:hypothetical protein